MSRPTGTRLFPYYFLFGLIAIAGYLSATNLATAIGRPFGGFYATFNHATNVWSISAATPPWWPVLASGQLRYDDQLVALNDQPYDATINAQFAKLYQNTSNSVASLTIRRQGQIQKITIPIQPFTVGNYLDLDLPDILVSLGFWLLGLAVFSTQAQNPVNRVFALAMSCIAGALWLSVPGLFSEVDGLSRMLVLFWVWVAAPVGITVVYLTALFPRPLHRSIINWLRLAYVIMLSIAGLYMVSYVSSWLTPTTPFLQTVFKVCEFGIIGSFGLGFLLYGARLLYLLTRPSLSRRLRRQSAILALGALLALPHVVIIVIRSLVGSSEDYFALGLDLRYLTLAIPITFAFVILRYQTLQRINPVVAIVFIIATSALFASVMAWILRLLDPAWANTLIISPFVPLFFISLVTAGFYSLQNTLRGTFSKVFQWEFRGYTSVHKFTQQVISRPESASVSLTITKALIEKLELECASLWIINTPAAALHLNAQSGVWPSPPPEYLPLWPATQTRPVRLLGGQPDSRPTPNWLSDLTQNGAIEIAAPLIASNHLVGVLGLGKRWDEEIFDDRDLDIIELAAQEAALFILTAQQIEELRQVPLQITAAQERERFKIAQELHDTVQQFLGSLPFYLQVSSKNARTDPATTEAILQRCINDVETAAQVVRQIRSNLAPFQLESGLLIPLGNLVQGFQIRTGLQVQTNFDSTADLLLTTEARHALYRVVQQALDNAAAHAEASAVILGLKIHDKRLYFTVTDNGHGASPESLKKAESEGSFGLVSMRARITSLGGEFEFASSAQAGSTVEGWLPF
jgi:signal transduction histidine kinase